MLKDRSAAENAVQHVFVKLWIGRQEMTVMLSLRNYLYTMTRNYILNYLRSRNTELVHSYRLAQLVPEASTRSTRRSSARIFCRSSIR